MPSEKEMLVLLRGLAQFGQGFAPQPQDFGNIAGNAAVDMANSRLAQIAVDEQEKARKKKEKSGMFGSIGGVAGGLLGTALAPATGGMSILGPAIGSTLGSTAGTALGGGDAGSAATSAALQQVPSLVSGLKVSQEQSAAAKKAAESGKDATKKGVKVLETDPLRKSQDRVAKGPKVISEQGGVPQRSAAPIEMRNINPNDDFAALEAESVGEVDNSLGNRAGISVSGGPVRPSPPPESLPVRPLDLPQARQAPGPQQAAVAGPSIADVVPQQEPGFLRKLLDSPALPAIAEQAAAAGRQIQANANRVPPIDVSLLPPEQAAQLRQQDLQMREQEAREEAKTRELDLRQAAIAGANARAQGLSTRVLTKNVQTEDGRLAEQQTILTLNKAGEVVGETPYGAPKIIGPNGPSSMSLTEATEKMVEIAVRGEEYPGQLKEVETIRDTLRDIEFMDMKEDLMLKEKYGGSSSATTQFLLEDTPNGPAHVLYDKSTGLPVEGQAFIPAVRSDGTERDIDDAMKIGRFVDQQVSSLEDDFKSRGIDATKFQSDFGAEDMAPIEVVDRVRHIMSQGRQAALRMAIAIEEGKIPPESGVMNLVTETLPNGRTLYSFKTPNLLDENGQPFPPIILDDMYSVEEQAAYKEDE